MVTQDKNIKTTWDSAKSAEPPHPLIGHKIMPPSLDGKFQLASWGTQEVVNHRGNPVQIGNIAIIDPNGNLLEISKFHSGGHGSRNKFKALPGLIEDLLPEDPTLNASYKIDWKRHIELTNKTGGIPATYLSESKKFGFVRFFSDRAQTPRGITEERASAKGAFAVHFDGRTYGSGKHYGDGTGGCLGFPTEEIGESFFRAIDAVATNIAQRPTTMIVLTDPPAGILQDLILAEGPK